MNSARRIFLYIPNGHKYVFDITPKTRVEEFVVLFLEYCAETPDLRRIAEAPHSIKLAQSLFYAD